MAKYRDTPTKGFIDVDKMLEEMERDLTPSVKPVQEISKVSGKEAILEILARAADDHKFLARLAEDSAKAMMGYNLTPEEAAALASGDIRRIELWVGKLDNRLSAWLWCRLAQEKW